MSCFQDLNLTIQMWFQFGLSQDTVWPGDDQAEREPPRVLEDRIEHVYKPLSREHTGPPDLIILGKQSTAFFKKRKFE